MIISFITHSSVQIVEKKFTRKSKMDEIGAIGIICGGIIVLALAISILISDLKEKMKAKKCVK